MFVNWQFNVCTNDFGLLRDDHKSQIIILLLNDLVSNSRHIIWEITYSVFLAIYCIDSIDNHLVVDTFWWNFLDHILKTKIMPMMRSENEKEQTITIFSHLIRACNSRLSTKSRPNDNWFIEWDSALKDLLWSDGWSIIIELSSAVGQDILVEKHLLQFLEIQTGQSRVISLLWHIIIHCSLGKPNLTIFYLVFLVQLRLFSFVSEMRHLFTSIYKLTQLLKPGK